MSATTDRDADTSPGATVADDGCPYCPETDITGIAEHLRWRCEGVKAMRREEMGLPDDGYENKEANADV